MEVEELKPYLQKHWPEKRARIAMAAKTEVKLRQKVVERTARNSGRALKQVIQELSR